MRALVITGPRSARVEEVEAPSAGPGQVVVDVRRAGVCGTDVELFTGQLAYFAQGKTRFPGRPGDEGGGGTCARTGTGSGSRADGRGRWPSRWRFRRRACTGCRLG